jgi:RNA polymerase sigma factor (sigma-70 family)
VKSAEQLVRVVRSAVAAGEPAGGAKEQLWNACRGVVAALAARYTRHAPDLREDLLSEGYLKFEQALATFDPNRGVPFRGFLSRCVARHFHDRARKKCERFSDRPPERGAEDDPLVRLGEQEQARRVSEALDGLLPGDPRRHRKLRAFRLRHVEGWSLKAIREELGAATTNAVAQWVYRVRQALRKELARRCPDLVAPVRPGEGGAEARPRLRRALSGGPGC